MKFLKADFKYYLLKFTKNIKILIKLLIKLKNKLL